MADSLLARLEQLPRIFLRDRFGNETGEQAIRVGEVLALCRAWQEEQGKEEISVCKRCKHPVRWHLTRLLYDCTNCGRIDGSARLTKVSELPADVGILAGDRFPSAKGRQEEQGTRINDFISAIAAWLADEGVGNDDDIREELKRLWAVKPVAPSPATADTKE